MAAAKATSKPVAKKPAAKRRASKTASTAVDHSLGGLLHRELEAAQDRLHALERDVRHLVDRVERALDDVAKRAGVESGDRRTAKKSAAKKPAAKKSVAKKPVVKKSAAKKSGAKQPVAKKSTAKK